MAGRHGWCVYTPWRLLGIAAALTAALSAWADATPHEIALSDAAEHEGDRVRVVGHVMSVEPAEGRSVLHVSDGQGGLVIQATAADIDVGETVQVIGRLVRLDGLLVLVADQVRAWTP